MRESQRCGRLLVVASLLTLASPTCGSSGGGPGSQFCNEWAAAFCKRVWACDPGNPFAGPSESECAQGYAMLCSQQQPAGQTFDPSCAGGKQVNQAAKMSCLNKLNTVSCADFSADTYDDDCDLVCTAGGTGGTGGTGGGGTGGSSGSTCGSVQPCGGDLVGTWTITGVCVSQPTTTDPNCPGWSVSNVTATETGTLTYAAGGTYTVNFNRTLQYTETTPQSCIDPGTCADLVYTYQLLGAAASCTGTTVCTCSVAVAASGAEAGTYVTSGTTFTATDSASGDVDNMAYCVQGNSLHLLSYNSAGQVTTEQTAQRQ
jgi:hypothetical protein